MNNDELKIRLKGKMIEVHNRIQSLKEKADGLFYWGKKEPIIAQCDVALNILDNLEERLESKLVVTLIGGCGIGKSTLFNALSKTDTLSDIGTKRPTTRELIICSADKHDAEFIVDKIGHNACSLCSSQAINDLSNIILIDTPDTDSTENLEHHLLLKQIIGMSDVLLCGFSAENPKRWDHLKFMKKFIDVYDKDNLYVFLNQCDRQDEKELKKIIKPDFKTHLEIAWNRKIADIFLISARNNLQNPLWDETAKPKHEYDEFDKLKKVFNNMSSYEFIVSSRLKKANHLYLYINSIIKENIEDVNKLNEFKKEILEIKKEAEEKAIVEIKYSDKEMQNGLTSIIYRRLASEWWGPVGWLIAIWARIITFGFGMMSLGKLKNPVLMAISALTAGVNWFRNKKAIDKLKENQSFNVAMFEYDRVFSERWPSLAEKFVILGFSDSVRETNAIMPKMNDIESNFETQWNLALEKEIDIAVSKASSAWLQFILNLLPLGLTLYIAEECIRNFLSRHYLSSTFFLHAIITLILLLLLCFVFLQFYIKYFSASKILTAAFNSFKDKYNSSENTDFSSPILFEIETILSLKGKVEKENS